MSIKTNAEQIRDETITGANTATRVGGNLVEIADDLIAKQIEIDVNTTKVGFTNALVDANTNVTANTAKVGITTGQASAIIANTSKVSFDSTSSNRLSNTSGTNTGDQDLSLKQNTLVSATNIKTINGATLLGSGNLVVTSSGGITGSGTVNALAKFTNSDVIGDSQIFETGSNVGIGINNPAAKLVVPSGQLLINTNSPNGVNALQVNGSGTLTSFLSIFTRLNLNGSTILERSGAANFIGDRFDSLPTFMYGGSNNIGISILTNSNVLIGATSGNNVDKLQVNGSAVVITLKTSGFTVATLPTPPAQGLGARAHVTDALNPTYLGTLTGGGTVKCPVFYNGTAWVSS